MDTFLSRTEDNRTVIMVRGETDLTNTAEFLRQLVVLARPATGQISLDLSQVTFMDCAGLRVLTAVSRHIEARGGSMRVTAVSSPVARLFELVGPLALLPRHAHDADIFELA